MTNTEKHFTSENPGKVPKNELKTANYVRMIIFLTLAGVLSGCAHNEGLQRLAEKFGVSDKADPNGITDSEDAEEKHEKTLSDQHLSPEKQCNESLKNVVAYLIKNIKEQSGQVIKISPTITKMTDANGNMGFVMNLGDGAYAFIDERGIITTLNRQWIPDADHQDGGICSSIHGDVDFKNDEIQLDISSFVSNNPQVTKYSCKENAPCQPIDDKFNVNRPDADKRAKIKFANRNHKNSHNR